MSAPGCAVFVVGPSGSGKDSLLRYAAAKLEGDSRFVFPRRTITRDPADGNESHESLTADEFARAAKRGEFALSWEAHGLRYGIPASIDEDLALGRTVAVNVSRNILADAVRRYPSHLIASIVAPFEVLAKRLAGRAREDAADISARITRKVEELPAGARVVTIVNNAALETAGDAFTALIRQTQPEDALHARALG